MADEKPVRIQLSRRKGWKMPPNTIKVDRSTPWGNPFVTGKHGDREACVKLHAFVMSGCLCVSEDNTAEQVAAYKFVRKNRSKLRGKNLACWCPLDKACHADLLLQIANRSRP